MLNRVVLFFTLMLGSVTGFSQYCTPGFTTGCDPAAIGRVVIADLDNPSTGCMTPQGYADFTSLVATLVPGTPYTITVSFENNLFTDFGNAWFDWEGDGFEEDDIIPLIGVSEAGDLVGVVTVPPDVVPGLRSRFRVIVNFLTPPDDPCLAGYGGECEDYTFFVPDPLLPQCATALAPDGTTECQNVTLSWTPPAAGEAPTGYKVYLGTGGTYGVVNGTLVTDTFLVVPSALTPATTYNWYVVPTNAAGDAQGCDSPVTFTTNPQANPTVDLPDGTQNFCLDVSTKLGGIITDGNGDGTAWTYAWTPTGTELTNDNLDSANFTPTASGDYTYYLNVTDDSNCVSMDSIEITVNALPDENIAGASSNYCYPSDAGLSIATASANIQWQISADNASFSDAANGTNANFSLPNASGVNYYRVALESADGCVYYSDTIQTNGIATPAKPNIDLINVADNGKFCSRDSAILKVTNYDTDLVWSTGSTLDSIIVKAAESYTVTYTVGICSSDSTVAVDVNPHPAKPVLNIGSTAAICPTEVLKAYPDILQDGMVWSTGETTDTITITFNGIYFLNVTNVFGCSTKSEESFVTVGADYELPDVDAPNGVGLCAGESVLLQVNNYSSGITWNDNQNTNAVDLNATEVGDYIASYTSPDNCVFSSVAIPVVALTIPETPLISASPENGLCLDSIITLTVSNFSSALWNDDNQTQAETILVSTNKLYTASVLSSDGCTSTGEYQLVLSPTSESPAIQVSQGQLVVDPDLGDYFIWYYEGNVVPNENGPAITPGQDGAYTVRAVQGNCDGAISKGFAWPVVGIQAISSTEEFSIFPNPTTGKIYLQNAEPLSQFEILDVFGRVVDSFIWMSNTDSHSVKHLSAGNYLLRQKGPANNWNRFVIVD
jgi:hypothetical protein